MTVPHIVETSSDLVTQPHAGIFAPEAFRQDSEPDFGQTVSKQDVPSATQPLHERRTGEYSNAVTGSFIVGIVERTDSSLDHIM